MLKCVAGVLLSIVAASSWAYSEAEYEALLLQCAPMVHPVTMKAVTRHESRGNFFAIGDSGLARLPRNKRVVRSFYPRSAAEGLALAEQLIAEGHIVDIGPAQVTHRNVRRLGYSLADAFEPCKNLRMGAEILTADYMDAEKRFGPSQAALQAALSAYNTGNFVDGFKNGYVKAVMGNVNKPIVPEVRVASYRAPPEADGKPWYAGLKRGPRRTAANLRRASREATGEVVGWGKRGGFADAGTSGS